VALPLFDGEIGIAESQPAHRRLGYGEMRIQAGGSTLTYYIDGVVQVADT
jgi:hypothetical protein